VERADRAGVRGSLADHPDVRCALERLERGEVEQLVFTRTKGGAVYVAAAEAVTTGCVRKVEARGTTAEGAG